MRRFLLCFQHPCHLLTSQKRSSAVEEVGSNKSSCNFPTRRYTSSSFIQSILTVCLWFLFVSSVFGFYYLSGRLSLLSSFIRCPCLLLKRCWPSSNLFLLFLHQSVLHSFVHSLVFPIVLPSFYFFIVFPWIPLAAVVHLLDTRSYTSRPPTILQLRYRPLPVFCILPQVFPASVLYSQVIAFVSGRSQVSIRHIASLRS